jgi:DNA adenine methylase
MQSKKIRSATRSLLRYPGSKARLTRFIAQSIKMNNLDVPVFIEPFCGGSSVSIALLESNIVEEVVLNDIDPIVAALWKCVFSKDNAKWLADAILHVPLDLKYWQYQKNLCPKNLREAALKCLYLNRTSFSGVLHSEAGPIGGRSQAKWTLGCRFNRDKLVSRILELSLLSKRVKAVTHRPWNKVCEDWGKKPNVFFYLDPPFYHKAQRLYRFAFDDLAHRSLRDYLVKFAKPWILSYDNADMIKNIYCNHGLTARIIDNTYSAHPMGGNSFIGRELIYANLKDLPLPSENQEKHAGIAVYQYSDFNTFKVNKLKNPMPWVSICQNKLIDKCLILR